MGCAGGCGFYGSVDQKNCCSLCYKKMYPEEAKNKQTTQSSNNKKDKPKESESKESEKVLDAQKEDKPKKKVQKKKNRCWLCRKKITLAGQFECKCGYVYCAKHRYPDSHSCAFDHKKQHQLKLKKDNKTVAPSKLDKI